MTNLCIIGNGIIGLQTAYAILERDRGIKITIVGPRLRPGSASLAAAAMFNSFCEIEEGTFENAVETKRFEFNKLSNCKWPKIIEELSSRSSRQLSHGFGTYLINNNGSDSLEDRNFDEVVKALVRYQEPYEIVDPRDIKCYHPEAKYRAQRALFIPREGWINPSELIGALEDILIGSKNVTFIDDTVLRLDQVSGKIASVETHKSGAIGADKFLVCNGASFSQLMDASSLSGHFQRVFYGVGCSILLNTAEDTLENCIRTPNRGLACGLYAAPQNPCQTLVGASNFISPEPSSKVKLTSVYTIIKSAMEQLNQKFHRRELERVNIGWRPTSSDTLPLLGKTSISNLMVATGTKRDGLHCSPIIAEFLADEFFFGRVDWPDFGLFAPERKPLRYLSRGSSIDLLVKHSINAAYQHDFVPSKSRMVEDLEQMYRKEFEKLHDEVGAIEWGIPPELKDMYKYGHITSKPEE